MDIKKSDKADLEKHKAYFFQIGLVISLVSVWLLFNYSITDNDEPVFQNMYNLKTENDIIPITRQQESMAPIPVVPRQIIKEIQVVEDNLPNTDIVDLTEETKEDDFEEISLDESLIEKTDKDLYFFVEQMPSFDGGTVQKFRTWIASNVKYPEAARQKKITGRVIVTFIIDENGFLSDVKITEGIDPIVDNEVLKVVKSAPRWNPGKQDGKPVKVQFKLPVIFSI